ncbi:MAG: hypothetical protein V4695_00690 [Pseudomonadota bacterium]
MANSARFSISGMHLVSLLAETPSEDAEVLDTALGRSASVATESGMDEAQVPKPCVVCGRFVAVKKVYSPDAYNKDTVLRGSVPLPVMRAHFFRILLIADIERCQSFLRCVLAYR